MSRRRRWLVFLAGTALVLATATGGFASGRADRAVEVAVVPDAYLGVTSESPVSLPPASTVTSRSSSCTTSSPCRSRTSRSP